MINHFSCIAHILITSCSVDRNVICHIQTLSYDLNESGPNFSISLLPLDCNMTRAMKLNEFGHKNICNVVTVNEFESSV